MNMKGDRRNNQLETIPGVGKSIAADLRELWINRVTDLAGRDPQKLYEELCGKRQASIDRCVLYVFRCAVYYADHDDPDPELLKWWNWKDHK